MACTTHANFTIWCTASSPIFKLRRDPECFPARISIRSLFSPLNQSCGKPPLFVLFAVSRMCSWACTPTPSIVARPSGLSKAPRSVSPAGQGNLLRRREGVQRRVTGKAHIYFTKISSKYTKKNQRANEKVDAKQQIIKENDEFQEKEINFKIERLKKVSK